MVDAAILEQLARPSGVMVGQRPLQLEEVFARVAADGWAPRRPAFEPELGQLEVSMARGTCCEPLLVGGDLLYIDPRLPPAAGDLVSFALSERGAAAQNSALPPGQLPARKGDRWAKLYVPYRGIDMLLEKYGHSATATLLSCEHPDDTPILHPVRNIRRDGRLLFTPPTLASQIGSNAVSQVAAAVASGTQTLLFPVAGTVEDLDVVSVTYTSTGLPTAVDVSADTAMVHTNSAFPLSGLITVRRDGSDVGTTQFDLFQAWTAMHSASQWWRGQVTLTVYDTPGAGAHTYSMHCSGNGGGTSGNSQAQFVNASIKVREYKR